MQNWAGTCPAQFVQALLKAGSVLKLQDVLQHDGLGVGHFIEGAHDALGADAGVLVATEGLLEGAVEARAVDDHAAGLKLASELRAGLLVGREDAAGQTELRGVGDLDGLLGGLEGDDGI